MRSKVLISSVIILLLVVVCACITLVLFNFRVSSLPISIQGISERIQGGALAFSAEASEQKSFTVSGAAFVDADTPYGNVTITGGAGDQIGVTAHKTAYGASQSAADANLQALKVTMTQDGSRVILRVQDPNAASVLHVEQANRVDYTITVPTETTASIHTNSGNISLSGTQGKADLNSSFGAVEVSSVKGGVAAHTGSGRVTVRNIQLLPTGFGDVTARSEFGDVTLSDISLEHVTAHSGSGSVVANNVASNNEIDLSSSYGGITLQGGDAASLKASTNSGEVTLNQVKVESALTAHSDFGALRLVGTNAGSYDVSSNSGGISIDRAQGPVKANTSFGDIVITSGDKAILDLNTNSGRIRYTGSLGEGSHTVKSTFGEIHLTLPADSALTLDLKTDFGRINTAFQVTTGGELDEKHLTGTINGGGATLMASTQNGDITLDKMETTQP